MGRVARIQIVSVTREGECQPARENVDPFLAIMLEMFVAGPIRRYGNEHGLQAEQAIRIGQRGVSEPVGSSRDRVFRADDEAWLGRQRAFE